MSTTAAERKMSIACTESFRYVHNFSIRMYYYIYEMGHGDHAAVSIPHRMLGLFEPIKIGNDQRLYELRFMCRLWLRIILLKLLTVHAHGQYIQANTRSTVSGGRQRGGSFFKVLYESLTSTFFFFFFTIFVAMK